MQIAAFSLVAMLLATLVAAKCLSVGVTTTLMVLLDQLCQKRSCQITRVENGAPRSAESRSYDHATLYQEKPDLGRARTHSKNKIIGNSELKSAGDKPYKVVCYFTNWAWYRDGDGKFMPEDIDANLCTHVIYSFAILDENTLEIIPSDTWPDIDNHFYEKIVSLRDKGVVPILGFGGGKDSESGKYSKLVNSPDARAHFVTQAVQYIEKYQFAGLDLDWEYPKCWASDCTRGPDSDKSGFAALVRELSAALKPRQLLLTAAVAQNEQVINLAYDVKTLSDHLDFINLMGYDYHGTWDGRTGHVAPLKYHEGDANNKLNVEFSVNYWLQLGVASEKLIVGMPTYGKSFKLSDPNNNGLNAPIEGAGDPGQFTVSAGTLAFYEICRAVKNDQWRKVRVDDGSMGPYATKGNQWVSYDDRSDVLKKSVMIKQKGLGGGMIWSLDFDDFKNVCGCGAYPLLRALNTALNGGSAPLEDCT